MNAPSVSLSTSVSVWALWGLLAAIPQSALGIGATPAVRGHAALDVTIGNAVREIRCLNNGAGGFTNCATFNDFDTSTGIALGDMNGDGKLDAVMVNYNAPAVRCLNDGAGGFTDCTTFNATEISRSFDAQYCNNSGNTLSNLRTRTVRLSQGNALHFNSLASNQYLTAPEWREGGIGAELVIPLGTGQYSDGQLAPTECATIRYPFHLFSLNRYRYAVRLYGVVAAPPPVDDPAPPGLMAARTMTASDTAAIELDLGPLAEAATPPVTLPGGTAPTPYAPALSFPAGVSNLPSRR